MTKSACTYFSRVGAENHNNATLIAKRVEAILQTPCEFVSRFENRIILKLRDLNNHDTLKFAASHLNKSTMAVYNGINQEITLYGNPKDILTVLDKSTSIADVKHAPPSPIQKLLGRRYIIS